MPRTAQGRDLRNHGLLTVGQTVEEAVWWFVAMERCCQAQFLAELVGKPLQIDPSNARATRAVNGAPFTGWFQCQPLWAAGREDTAGPASIGSNAATRLCGLVAPARRRRAVTGRCSTREPDTPGLAQVWARPGFSVAWLTLAR